MNPETQQSESPYCVKIETETGQSATVPIAVLTPKQLEVFLQSEFKRLAQEAGVKGVRIHVERAMAADYEQVLREVTACLSILGPNNIGTQLLACAERWTYSTEVSRCLQWRKRTATKLFPGVGQSRSAKTRHPLPRYRGAFFCILNARITTTTTARTPATTRIRVTLSILSPPQK